MIRSEKQTKPRTYDVVVEHTCELCGCDLLTQEDPYETREATISCKEGDAYHPGEGYGTETIVDVCVKCMKEKVFPWLVSVGATVRKEECDY